MRGGDQIETVFSAYITNAGTFGEGRESGGMLRFPTTAEKVQALLKRIGVDGVRYQEVFIPCFDDDVLGVCEYLGEFEGIDELNHLACLLSELDEASLSVLEAVVDKGDHSTSAAELINLALNLDCYDLYPGIHDDDTLGRVYVEDMELLDVPENVQPYFDYDAYGRDARFNEHGYFAPGGYLLRNGNQFVELYHGPEDIPPEHKVFTFPPLNIREQMTAYKEVSDRAAPEPGKGSPGQEHEDR